MQHNCLIECRWTVHVVSEPSWGHSSLCVAVTETIMTKAAVTDAVQDVAVKPVSEIRASVQSEANHKDDPVLPSLDEPKLAEDSDLE